MKINQCSECAKKDAVIAALQEAIARRPASNVSSFKIEQQADDPTAGCPCRPENGGSGICGCIMGARQVTC